MKLFSHRRGLKKIRTEIQVDSIDAVLRNCLWNLLMLYYWDRMGTWISDYGTMKTLFTRLWNNYFKKPLDTLNNHWETTYKQIRSQFFNWDWNEIYDFIEFVAKNYPDEEKNDEFRKACNVLLQRELSAYRFVGKEITEITSKEEISEIEEALATPLKPVKIHLENSLRHLSDKKNPDFRNSIKEAISAVEAICSLITKNKKATLGQALKEVETKVGLHGALKEAFSNLYGYTSSADGIRHALLDETNLDFEDAKFMLVSCSAFINYLVSKAGKAKIEF